eukprot:c17547_g1_i1.p1 GENE.c17547_g1_i1~~c17547_g1_i1.p1  ORF type:complete len:533 (-),score=100.60 c17547_g1_i1:107-1705(-)
MLMPMISTTKMFLRNSNNHFKSANCTLSLAPLFRGPIAVGLSRRNFHQAVGVNQFYQPSKETLPTLSPKNNKAKTPNMDKHKKHAWSQEEVYEATKAHSVFTWGASSPLLDSTIAVDRAEGIYLFDKKGKRYIDWSSGAVCSNLGHTMPEGIKQAIIDQMQKVSFVYGDLAYHDVRARLCSLLAEVTPGDIDAFVFACGGSEANEAAIRIARRFTGRQKIISRYRSYHGSTAGAMAVTGDFRKWGNGDTSAGFVKMMDPFPYHFAWGETEELAAQRCLQALHEQILFEGPDSVAAVFLEPISGANGWLIPPVSFMWGVRALCDKYNILLICDEVMSGFGRTGRMFGFEHFDGVVPDMITFAKGVTSAYMPLSGVGMRSHIFDHFRTNPLGYGSTYAAHPLSCAAAYATISHILETNLLSHVQEMELVMIEELSKLSQKHPSVKQARCVGLGAGFDMRDPEGNFLVPMHGSSACTNLFKKRLKELGVVTMVRGHFVHCTPPLVITADQIREGISLVSKALDSVDEYLASANKN